MMTALAIAATLVGAFCVGLSGFALREYTLPYYPVSKWAVAAPAISSLLCFAFALWVMA